jgi:hypothetical protein
LLGGIGDEESRDNKVIAQGAAEEHNVKWQDYEVDITLDGIKKLKKLCDHVLALEDDSYFQGHPEWEHICNDAREAKKEIDNTTGTGRIINESKTAQVNKQEQMVKEVPMKVKPVKKQPIKDEKTETNGKQPMPDNKDVPEGKEDLLGDKEEVNKENELDAEGNPIESEEDPKVKEQMERADETNETVMKIKKDIIEAINAIWRIELGDDEVKELVQKIITLVNNTVSDNTLERVKEIAGDELKTQEQILKDLKK